MAIINLIDGEKGGVGKSWVARTMLQYLIDNAIPRASIETDRSNPTVLNIYKESKAAVFSENEKMADVADAIFEYALKKRLSSIYPLRLTEQYRNGLTPKDYWIWARNMT